MIQDYHANALPRGVTAIQVPQIVRTCQMHMNKHSEYKMQTADCKLQTGTK